MKANTLTVPCTCGCGLLRFENFKGEDEVYMSAYSRYPNVPFFTRLVRAFKSVFNPSYDNLPSLDYVLDVDSQIAIGKWLNNLDYAEEPIKLLEEAASWFVRNDRYELESQCTRTTDTPFVWIIRDIEHDETVGSQWYLTETEAINAAYLLRNT